MKKDTARQVITDFINLAIKSEIDLTKAFTEMSGTHDEIIKAKKYRIKLLHEQIEIFNEAEDKNSLQSAAVAIVGLIIQKNASDIITQYFC